MASLLRIPALLIHWPLFVYRRALNSIAFYPVLFSVLSVVFALAVVSVEFDAQLTPVKHYLSVVLVNNAEDARLILSVLVGSIISLMVFSFSMVMIVLNRASATLSPRLIPGLLTNRHHQIVLGYYLGTILFTLIIMVNFLPQRPNAIYFPQVGVFLSMVFGVISLLLFVYFIHAISQSIQVDTILALKVVATRRELQHHFERETFTDASCATSLAEYELVSLQSGYFKGVNKAGLLQFCRDNQCQLVFKAPVGTFYLTGEVIALSSMTLSETQRAELSEYINFYPEELLEDHFTFGCQQISDIAVKALSPGINDPASAIKAIDMLASIVCDWIRGYEESGGSYYNYGNRIFLPDVELNEVLYQAFTAIREYGKADSLVMSRLLQRLQGVLTVASMGTQREYIDAYIESLVESCSLNIQNSLDKDRINQVIDSINHSGKCSSQLTLLK